MLGKNKNSGLYLHQCLNVEMGHRKWTLGFDSISYLRTVKIKRLSDNMIILKTSQSNILRNRNNYT
jgi:hypothetical protein